MNGGPGNTIHSKTLEDCAPTMTLKKSPWWHGWTLHHPFRKIQILTAENSYSRGMLLEDRPICCVTGHRMTWQCQEWWVRMHPRKWTYKLPTLHKSYGKEVRSGSRVSSSAYSTSNDTSLAAFSRVCRPSKNIVRHFGQVGYHNAPSDPLREKYLRITGKRRCIPARVCWICCDCKVRHLSTKELIFKPSWIISASTYLVVIQLFCCECLAPVFFMKCALRKPARNANFQNCGGYVPRPGQGWNTSDLLYVLLLHKSTTTL